MELIKILYAEAAHRNPSGGPKQQRLHGHSYKLEILAEGVEDERYGWVVDYGEIKTLFQPVYDQLDHGYLNDFPGLEDTTLPGLRTWIEAQLQPWPSWLRGVRVSITGDLAFQPVRLPASTFEALPERVEFTFEAAQSLPQLTKDHPCYTVHGHSYRMQLAGPDLDALKAAAADLYETFDHCNINDLPDLQFATCEHIARWVWRALVEKHGTTPTHVIVQETPTASCIYTG